ncbi:biotin/lipoyl-binding protein [Microbacterium sp. bgisy189]|uniref:HlyD family efflux transporter periplasmic adaptor subunit n=1 Tax=Microbacterium sp. bgisy189 TaxID=3413798 RepID=UPI003EBD5436
MTWASRLKLTLGLIIVVALVAVGTIVFNQRQNSAQSTSAEIVADAYAVGTDYGGTVTELYVHDGDAVAAGDPLFAVQSLALQLDIASGYTVDSEHVADDGTTTVVASVAGTVTDVSVVQGGFAPAGSVLATIDRERTLSVDADFVLTARDYVRIATDAEAEILLPSGETLVGAVSSVDVATADGQALSTVSIDSAELADETATGLFQSGTPVTVTLRLRDDGPLAGISDAFGDLLRKIGL